MNKLLSFLKKRPFIQAVAAVMTNPHLGNFFTGTIYTGGTKVVCVPGLNCYSCPGAAGACPIGALQAVMGGNRHNFSFYVVGILILFGAVFGRLICGFLCPFGWIQDLLYKIPTKKFHVPPRLDKPMRKLKYVILLLFMLVLPLALSNEFGLAAPYFCKLICPAGTLEGGIPLLLTNPSLRSAIGVLFDWKLLLLIVTILASVFTYRPFCKYICPLGAIYSLFNRVSFYQMDVDKTKCTGCKICERQCKMNVEITKNINSLECIRCGECKGACTHGAITSSFRVKPHQGSPAIAPGAKD